MGPGSCIAAHTTPLHPRLGLRHGVWPVTGVPGTLAESSARAVVWFLGLALASVVARPFFAGRCCVCCTIMTQRSKKWSTNPMAWDRYQSIRAMTSCECTWGGHAPK